MLISILVSFILSHLIAVGIFLGIDRYRGERPDLNKQTGAVRSLGYVLAFAIMVSGGFVPLAAAIPSLAGCLLAFFTLKWIYSIQDKRHAANVKTRVDQMINDAYELPPGSPEQMDLYDRAVRLEESHAAKL